MCGIIGYIGNNEVHPILIDGLKRLEYRGYDSAGIATIENGELKITKETGRISNLEQNIPQDPLPPTPPFPNLGIGHTRWATHGEVSISNTPPPPQL